MKLDPGFINHWKTQHLLDELGGDGLVALLRLWGQAQIKREWQGLALTPKRLAMETKWKANENHLFQVMTNPDAPWLDLNDDGTFDIHGFEEHQKQVIHLWKQGGRGGRPKKDSEALTNTNNTTKDIDTYSSSSSSSYPISEPNGNHMVILSDSIKKKNKSFKKPTIKEIEDYSAEISAGIQAEAFFDFYETKGWVIGKSPMKDWKACIRTWKRSNQEKNQTTKNRFAGTQEQIELP